MSVQTCKHVNPDTTRSTGDWGSMIWKVVPWVIVLCWVLLISGWVITAMTDMGTVVQ
jgi:hypothetical protein